MVKNYALKWIKDMTPYSPPLGGRLNFSGDLLDFNERVTTPSKKVTTALIAFFRKGKIQRYPEYADLQEKISKYAKVLANQVMITNGSDHGIDVIFRTFVGKNDTIVIPAPTFPMFMQYAQMIGCRVAKVPYEKIDFKFPAAEILQLLKNKNPKLIIICNPNNPTGSVISMKDIEVIVLKAPDSIFMIDEAYFEFSGISATSLLKKFPNIVIVRTFSKAFGLASLRIGYVIASEQHIEEMMKVRGPYAVNMAAHIAANAALDDIEDMKMYVQEVMTKAKPLLETFFKKNSIPFYKSGANFILFEPKNKQEVYEHFKKNDILVRPQRAPEIQDMLRVSIGTVKQMNRFIKVYSQLLG
ncbi:MAG: histidinol-phosphate transaminase [Patescibacteria group bacterium]